MKPLLIYADTSVIGGCEDPEFAADTLPLWRLFVEGRHTLVLSVHTLRELGPAPEGVRSHLLRVPREHQVLLADSSEAFQLAERYTQRGVVGCRSLEDAIHVALATVGRVDVLVSWNFKHMVNLDRIRRFNAVNLEEGYGIIEIRTPKEVVDYEQGF